MALIKCPECGKEISEYAEFCLGCGCPMRIIDWQQGNLKGRGMFRLLSNILDKSDCPVPTKNFLDNEKFIQLLDDILGSLTLREEGIIRYRFGLIDGSVYSYEELSVKYDVTKARICQIESKALRKLQHPSRRDPLKVMLEFPTLELLKHEAKNRGYIVWTDTEHEPKAWRQSGFSRCCYELLRMYDPALGSGELLGYSIENLDLSVQSYNCLKRANINDVEELIALSFSELQQVRNLNSDNCQEIVEKLSSMGLELRKDE